MTDYIYCFMYLTSSVNGLWPVDDNNKYKYNECSSTLSLGNFSVTP